MLEVEKTALAVVDMQGKLTSVVQNHQRVTSRILHMIKAAELHRIPILWSEQAPEKIGPTIPEIRDLLSSMVKPIVKRTFSCMGCPEYLAELKSIQRRQILVVGIETHVCVYQTVRDMRRYGYEVHVVADAVSSRGMVEHTYALDRMRQEGITITTAEMAACELVKSADNPNFKEMLDFLKKLHDR